MLKCSGFGEPECTWGFGLCWQVLLQIHNAHVHGEVAMEEKQHFTQRLGHFQVPLLIFPISASVLPQPGWEHCAEIGQCLIKSNGLMVVVSWM